MHIMDPRRKIEKKIKNIFKEIMTEFWNLHKCKEGNISRFSKHGASQERWTQIDLNQDKL